MAKDPNNKGSRLLSAALLAGVSWYALDYTGPITRGSAINPFTATLWVILTISGTVIVSEIFKIAAGVFQWLAAITPTKVKGSAEWTDTFKEIRKDIILSGYGPFWGAFLTKRLFCAPRLDPVFADFESNSLVAGTAGSGKNITMMTPDILSIEESMAINDFKGELVCTTANALVEKGFNVKVLNLGDKFLEILGASDSYNGLNLITDCFLQKGRLLDVSTLCHEKNLQLLPEPEEGGKDDNGYFRVGGRDMLEFAEIFEIVSKGASANLGDVDHLLSNRKELLESAQWVCGTLPKKNGGHSKMPLEGLEWTKLHDPEEVRAFLQHFRDLAAKVSGLLGNTDSSSGESFLSEAQQAVALFHKATRVYRKISHSTFRFGDLKEGERPTVVFIVIDSANLESQSAIAGYIQWCMLSELKRHPNLHRPVYFLCDEATNFHVAGFGAKNSILTWGRGSGIHIKIYVQSLAAWVARYGKEALSILLSETEIKAFLPGQRDPDTLDLIQRLLAKRSVIMRGRRGNREKSEINVDSIDYREEAVPLMHENEIRETDKTILFLKKQKPMLLEPIKFAETDIWRDVVDINPYHNKPFKLPIRLRIKRDRRPLWMRFTHLLTFWRRSL